MEIEHDTSDWIAQISSVDTALSPIVLDRIVLDYLIREGHQECVKVHSLFVHVCYHTYIHTPFHKVMHLSI